MRETVMVTGAAGLIGNALRIRLEAEGRPVLPIDMVAATEEGRPIAVGDVTDINRLHALASEHDVQGIIHCGAFSGPMVARDNPYAIVQVNLVGTANLLELARIRKMRRVVFCSSVSAVGSTPEGLEPVPEEIPLHPTTVYGASKAGAEALIDGYATQHGLDAVSLRISWVYGPRRRTDCAVREMILSGLECRPVRFPFGADFYRQFVHVDDVTRALVLAFDAKHPSRRNYTITGGEMTTLAELAKKVRALLPEANIEVAAGSDPRDDVQRRFDISAAARDLGYRPTISLADGVRSYTEWLRARMT